MRISMSSEGGFDKTLKWLSKAVETKPIEAMREIGEAGVNSLAANTPRDTGETASGWDYVITNKWGKSEIEWFNTAHPELKYNMAKLIELGHGTGNGGFIPPRPYMQKSMDKIFKDAMGKIAKGLIE